jgi:hypothetical protein
VSRSSPLSRALRFEKIRPEPARFWVRSAPRGWPGPQADFVDLARGNLAAAALRGSRPRPALPEDDFDTVYLPPVAGDSGRWRNDLLDRVRARGTPTLVQVLAGEEPPAAAENVVVDPTAALLGANLESLDEVPRGCAVVWPLIAGLTDVPDLVREGCRRLSAAGASSLQPVVPVLTPAERRRLADRAGEQAYHALFHGPGPRAEAVVRAALGAGLEPWTARPGVAVPGATARNRKLAEHLARLAEWWMLLGRAEGRAQSFFRAARWVDEESRDVAAIAREGNLAVVDWLEPACRREIERFAVGDAATVLGRLAAELVAGEDG